MKYPSVLEIISERQLRIFTLRDMLALLPLPLGTLSQQLARLSEKKLLIKLKRGVWLNAALRNWIHPYEAVPYLCAPYPAYVSLHSALNFHGLLEQVPTATYAISAGKTATTTTLQGQYRIHHLQAKHIWGYTQPPSMPQVLMAEPEKALLDSAYLQLRAGKNIALFPELDLSLLNKTKLTAMLKRFGDERLSHYLKNI